MTHSDGVINTQTCVDAWLREIGDYGDVFRMAIVNRIIARTLNYFGEYFNEKSNTDPIANPHSPIMTAYTDDLLDTDEKEKLINKYKDETLWTDKYKKLSGTNLLDLGSGNSYLGSWLSTLGVKYTGVEASLPLYKMALKNQQLTKAHKKGTSYLFNETISNFCRNSFYKFETAPTLISMIGVVDVLADPRENMESLFYFLACRRWNVPILVTTFDPDFFLFGLPLRDENICADPYCADKPLHIRDPALWEEQFVDCGFHVLEQRPLHISDMCTELSKYAHQCHEKIISRDTDISKMRVLPRQGPFYFWLLSPRNMTTVDKNESKTTLLRQNAWRESFSQDQVLVAPGNLGRHVYRVENGCVCFESGETDSMPFYQGDLFGHLELQCNYIASRILGDLSAGKKSTSKENDSDKNLVYTDESHDVTVVNSRALLNSLQRERTPASELLLTLLKHLNSVQFKSSVNPSRSSTMKTDSTADKRHINGRRYAIEDIQNIAAYLLQEGANTIEKQSPGSCRSRVVINFKPQNLLRFVYGRQGTVNQYTGRSKRQEIDYRIFSILLQNNVIDCFSLVALREKPGFFYDFNDKSSKQIGYYMKSNEIVCHMGLLAARFILCNFNLSTSAGVGAGEQEKTESFELLVDEISFYLKTEKPLGQRSKNKNAFNKIVELIDVPDDQQQKLIYFLQTLYAWFCFDADSPDYSTSTKGPGLSGFMVIRDIWALIGCLLNNSKIWEIPAQSEKKHYDTFVGYMDSKKEQLKPRILAYLQECIAYAGRQSGLNDCPW